MEKEFSHPGDIYDLQKEEKYIFKKVLGCVGFPSAYREVGLGSILL